MTIMCNLEIMQTFNLHPKPLFAEQFRMSLICGSVA